jgi:hypothetical protein
MIVKKKGKVTEVFGSKAKEKRWRRPAAAMAC